jgi:2-methylcitrate dehydratase PrpD
MGTGPTEALARYAGALSLDAVPASVIDRLKTLVLDHLGCALGGSRTR